MAETQTAPATVEINDAIFCTHFKEVVSRRFAYLHSPNANCEIVSNRSCMLTSFPSSLVHRVQLRRQGGERFLLWGGLLHHRRLPEPGVLMTILYRYVLGHP